MRKRFRFQSNRKGFTLVELMVSFTLLLILLAAVVAAISPAIRIFDRIVNVSRTQSVSSLVMDKIVNELEGATGNVYVQEHKVAYDDRDGNQVILSAKEEEGSELTKLWLHYQPVYDEASGEEKAVEWYFTDKVYMGNEIGELSFRQENTRNLLRVTLKIKNSRTDFSYERTRVISCYKLEEAFVQGEFPEELY